MVADRPRSPGRAVPQAQREPPGGAHLLRRRLAAGAACAVPAPAPTRAPAPATGAAIRRSSSISLSSSYGSPGSTPLDLEVALQVGARQTERARRGGEVADRRAGWPGGCRSRRPACRPRCRRTPRSAPAHRRRRAGRRWPRASRGRPPAVPSHRPRRSSSPASPPSHRLRIEIQQPCVRVVPRLDLPVGRAAVERPELVLVVEGVGVQRLVAAVLGDGLLDAPVDVAVRGARRDRHGRPEADVDVRLAPAPAGRAATAAARRRRRTGRPGRRRAAAAGTARPAGSAPRAGTRRGSRRCARAGSRRPAPPAPRSGSTAQPVDPGGQPVPVLQPDQLPVDVAAQPALGPEPADRRMLGTEGAGAPEPVGVPAPQVVADGRGSPPGGSWIER